MMNIKCRPTNLRKENCKRFSQGRINTKTSNYLTVSEVLILVSKHSPFDIGRIKSSMSESSMDSMPKSSRTAPYLFIVLGLMILNFVSWTHFSKFSTWTQKLIRKKPKY